jgi:hypothetical protein
MGGRGEPPEGVPDGVPGGDDEFRSVVFDESFIRAARIQELSARERMNAAAHPVRSRVRSGGALPRQALALMLLIAMAFAAAVYLGIRHPYRETVNGGIELTTSVVPLQPASSGRPTASAPTSASATASASAGATVSGPVASSDPFTGTAVQQYAVGAAGIVLPNPQATDHFTKDEVIRALGVVQQYLVDSSLLPDALLGAGTGGVRDLLDPAEQAQFDQSLADPRDDRRHQLTGWLVRFDPAEVRLAVDEVRVAGTVGFQELDDGHLQVTSDHSFIYALRPAPGAPGSPVLLFTVRREIVYRFTHDDIAGSRLELADSVTQAGPMSCTSDTSAALHPLFPSGTAKAAAGHSATLAGPSAAVSPSGTPGVNPLDRSRPAWAVCGVLGGPAL